MSFLEKLRHLPLLVLPLLTTLSTTAQNFNLQWRATLEFPGQTVSNVGGYVQNGREYALACASEGPIIVDVTEPDTPLLIVQIPTPYPVQEVKVYQHYAYVTDYGGAGLLIIDLSNLPDTNLTHHYYMGDGEIAGQFTTSHTLHIDTTKGFLYLHSTSLATSLVLDLNTDPFNPVYAGQYDLFHSIHDGYVDNDTLYACHYNQGLLIIVDMSDKQNPVMLGSTPTPGNFTHSSWLLSDHRFVLTSDEATPSFITAFDITDPSDILELDRVATSEAGNQSLAHNIDVVDDWAVISWYRDGVVIIDAHKPDNLVITGWYDTNLSTGNGFGGCFGAFPGFPSGTIAATNMYDPGSLILLTPNYVRATYVEGTVTNACNGALLDGVKVSVGDNAPYATTHSDFNGSFNTGLATTDSFTVTFSKAGYISQTFPAYPAPGEVLQFNIILEAEAYNISATIVDGSTNAPLANTQLHLFGPAASYTVQTDANGQFNQDCMLAGSYEAVSDIWGLRPGILTVASDGSDVLVLEKGYYDGFALDFGWTISGTATLGVWERGVPIGGEFQGLILCPGMDIADDISTTCYVTGNGGLENNVNIGSSTLTSPNMDLSEYADAVLSFYYWFFTTNTNTNSYDRFKIQVTNGSQSVTILNETQSQSQWRFLDNIHLADYLTLTDQVKISFTVNDQPLDNIVEGALDIFQLVPVTSSSTQHVGQQALVQVTPNPSNSDFALQYDWAKAAGATLEVRNLLGQTLLTRTLSGDKGTVQFGSDLPRGAYSVVLRKSDGQQSTPVKVMKQ